MTQQGLIALFLFLHVLGAIVAFGPSLSFGLIGPFAASVMDRFGRLILEELIQGRATREIEQLSLSAEERYDRLVKRSPHLLQLVPQKDIASYLRMKPETFSRLRARRS